MELTGSGRVPRQPGDGGRTASLRSRDRVVLSVRLRPETAAMWTDDGLMIVIRGQREDWRGGTRTLTPCTAGCC